MSDVPASPVRGVVVAHGGMATGMVDAVRRIAGVGEEVLVPLSNEGKGPDALRAELDRLIGHGRVVVFTDMHAGSCAVAARVACRARGGTTAEGGGRAVVCGVNLPMLLEFVFNRELPLDQLVPRLVEHGRAAVTAHLPHADPAVSG
jgi:mannose/fructose-specific phosphotransferase system component IIA